MAFGGARSVFASVPSVGASLIVLAAVFAGCIGPRDVPHRGPPDFDMPTHAAPTVPTIQGPPTLTPLTPSFPHIANGSRQPVNGSGSSSGPDDGGTDAATSSPPPTGSSSPDPPEEDEPSVAPGQTTETTAEWRDPGTGAAVSHAPPWTSLTLTSTFTLHYNGTVALQVWADISFAYDRPLATVASANLTPGVHTLTGSFETTPDNLTSFVPAIVVNGQPTWYPQGSPPRLVLDMPRGHANVTSVEWLSSGAPVSGAPAGTAIVARVTVAASGGGFVDELYVDVRTDVAFADDRTATSATQRVDIPDGSSVTIDVPFTVESGGDVRGHYVHVHSQGRWFCPGHLDFFGASCSPPRLDFQHEGYPPRLSKT